MLRLARSAVFFIALCAALAQSPSVRPPFDAFEVATIKPADPDFRGRYIRMQSTNRFQARNHSLKTLIQAAYNLTPRAVSGGPAWVETDKYEIVAETPGNVRPSLDEQMAMLRRLLADRFKLTFHREEKEFSIYALTVAKNGPKLNESKVLPDALPEGPPPLVFSLSPDGASMAGRYATVSELASVLQRAALDRPVVDRTGLSGRYDFDLSFAPDDVQFEGAFAKTPVPTDRGKHDLFAAIQEQLGLRLEATRGPIATLVIDHAEKPADN